MGAAAVRMGVVGCVSSASVFLFRDIKISFGAFASTDSYVDLFSTPENTRHKMLPPDFIWRQKDMY
jgi:hypothetical protein